MKTYKASLDTTAKVITGFVFLIVLFGALMGFQKNNWFLALMIGLIPACLLFFTYIFSIQSYQITEEKLIIKRPLPGLNKEILLSEIESVKLISKEDLNGTIRTAGDGGLFGYYGYFFNKKLGNFTMYATNNKNLIVLIVGELKTEIVVSPDDATMLDVLQKRLNTRV